MIAIYIFDEFRVNILIMKQYGSAFKGSITKEEFINIRSRKISVSATFKNYELGFFRTKNSHLIQKYSNIL